ncbi:MAG: class I SAM-dependent methyltransferase [Phycisphaerales bacterium]|nr:class I SAM-dependent methyltransferase [Phycisphaerales bacterium]
MSSPLNKTITRADVRRPEVARQAGALRRFAWRLFLGGDRYAVNGVLKRRCRIRWNKLWEYSRGLAYVPWQANWKVVDFGGGATIPVYYLADQGLDVASFDIDEHLTGAARATAKRHGWKLHASTSDLTEPDARDRVADAPAPGSIDWAISFCVLEHLPRERQHRIARLLGESLRSGGHLTVTFDYSPDAPVEGALRSEADVHALIEATGLVPQEGPAFHDTGERFVLDKKYPDNRFTFGSLFLRKP